MSRPRITEEQAIERYGSLEKYEAHLAQGNKWYRDHADQQKDYRWSNRERERARAKKWRSDHPDRIKNHLKERRDRDPVFREECRVRVRSRCLAISLGIYPEDSHIHHCWGFEEDSFVILYRKDHRFLHSKYGRDNENVAVKEVLDSLKELKRKPIFVYKGEVVSAQAVRSLA